MLTVTARSLPSSRSCGSSVVGSDPSAIVIDAFVDPPPFPWPPELLLEQAAPGTAIASTSAPIRLILRTSTPLWCDARDIFTCRRLESQAGLSHRRTGRPPRRGAGRIGPPERRRVRVRGERLAPDVGGKGLSEETGPRSSRPTRLVVGLTGHPEAGLGVRLLELLRDAPIETHLVMCGCARDWVARTTGRTAEDVSRLADHVYDEANQAAKISSGSFLTAGMIVAPCSSRSLGSIAIGYASNLIHRAADVTLKEGRRLVLLVPASALGPGSAES